MLAPYQTFRELIWKLMRKWRLRPIDLIYIGRSQGDNAHLQRQAESGEKLNELFERI